MTPADVPATAAVPTNVVTCLVPVAGVWCAGLGARSARLEHPLRLGLGAIAGLAAWGATIVGVTEAGLLWGGAGRPTSIWLPLAWLLPMAALLWLLRRTPRLRAALASRAGMAWLAYTMTARSLGAVFLILHGRGQLPTLFAYPAAIGDIVIGVTAPAAAWVLAFRTDEVHRPGSPWRAAVIGWNVLGFAEMLMAVTLGTILFPGPLQLIHQEPTTALFGHLPLVLFPTYLVCFASTVHLFLLDVLLRPPGRPRRTGPGQERPPTCRGTTRQPSDSRSGEAPAQHPSARHNRRPGSPSTTVVGAQRHPAEPSPQSRRRAARRQPSPTAESAFSTAASATAPSTTNTPSGVIVCKKLLDIYGPRDVSRWSAGASRSARLRNWSAAGQSHSPSLAEDAV